jgi:hypothetical protein
MGSLCRLGWSPFLLALASMPGPSSVSKSAAVIIQRSLDANERDWRAEPLYDHCERVDDGDSVRTYAVTMVEGTPYERLVAVNDRPIAQADARQEQDKLQTTKAERRRESASERRDRIGAYQKTHERLRDLFREVGRAFAFTLQGTGPADGRTAFVIDARPRPGYDPPTRDAQALTGMDARFWVDTATYHWIRVAAHLKKAVSIVGFLVRVEPGTTVKLEKAPVDGAVWLTTHLQIRSSSRILFVFGHHTYRDEREYEYRRTGSGHTSACLEK